MGTRLWLALPLLTAQAVNAAAPAADVPGWAGVKGDVIRGAARSTELYCSVCHGAAGGSTTPEWPSLAGQQPAYLLEQLTLFRAKRRTSPEMEPMAVTLTDTDMVDLASYFAAQTLVPPAAAGPIDDTAGRLYREGAPARGIAACSSCHGMDGKGEPALRAPALRSQQAAYVLKQLQAYAQGSRYRQDPPPAAAAMSEQAARLTEDEMSALSAWLRRLD